MSKRTHDDADTELILTAAQNKLVKKLNLNKAQAETVNNILSEGEDDLPLLIELFRRTTSQPLKTYPAGDYTDVVKAADDFGLEYQRFKSAYHLGLKDSELRKERTLDTCTAAVLEKLHTSPYTQHRQLESLSRTMLDLIFLDRLENLQDQHAPFHLRLSPETPISANTYGTGRKIAGRVDWALNYETPNQCGSILIVIEAKKIGNASIGLAQLVVYMVGVLESRHDRLNQSVFGMLSDSGTFQFAFLDQNKKLYLTTTFTWDWDQSKILAYIDTILLDAIQSSPHTTPTKIGNRSLNNYRQYLEERWVFGDGSEDKAKEDIKKESIVDVFQDENMVVRTKRHEDKDGENEEKDSEA